MYFSSILLFTVLLLASVTYVRNRKIPNWLTYGGLLLAFLLAVHADWAVFEKNLMNTIKNSFGGDSLLVEQFEAMNDPEAVAIVTPVNTTKAICGCVALAIPLLLLFTCGGVGGGDVKLGACIGAFAGLESGLSIIFFGHLLAGLFALLCIIRNRRSAGSATGIPMAVFYSLGTLAVTSGVLR